MFLSPSRALGFLVSINIAAGKGVVFIKCNPSRWSWIGVVKSPMDFFEDGIFVSCSLSLQLVHHYFESVLNLSFPFLSLCTFCSFLFKVIIISNHLRTRSSFVSIKFIVHPQTERSPNSPSSCKIFPLYLASQVQLN